MQSNFTCDRLLRVCLIWEPHPKFRISFTSRSRLKLNASIQVYVIPRKAFYTNQTQNIYGSHVDTCKYNKDFSIEFELTQSKVVTS